MPSARSLIVAALFATGVGLIAGGLARSSRRGAVIPPAPTPTIAVVPVRATAPDAAATLPRFRDIAAEAGLTVAHFEAADGQFRLVETMGGGVGLIDFDGDGWIDIFVAQGCPIPADPSAPLYHSQLYRNNRNGTFAEVATKARVGFTGYATGIAVGDFDGDGRDDLYVAAFSGPGALYRNRGDGTFEDVTGRAGVGGSGWATSSAFADLDGDGDLDLYVAHYLAGTVDERGRPTISCNALPGAIGYCPPAAFPGEPDALYRNNGDGTFTDMKPEADRSNPPGKGLGLAIDDFDDDGRLDVFVANDQTPNLLFRNLGGLKFDEVAESWGLAYNEAGSLRAGMGVAAGDADDDGRIDLLVTNFYEEGSTLYRNAAPGRFTVETAAARLLAPSRSRLGFGAGFLDADDDGRYDLFVANGHVNDVRPLGIPYAMTPQLFRGLGGGRFADVSAKAGPYFGGEWLGRGAAIGDIDNDGDPDIVVTHLGRPPALLLNETSPAGRSLRLTLRGAGPCHDATGARVTVEAGGRRVVRSVTAGTSYLSSIDRRVLIGLGAADRVDRLTIRWLNGKTQSWSGLPAGGALVIDEGREPRPAAEGKPGGR